MEDNDEELKKVFENIIKNNDVDIEKLSRTCEEIIGILADTGKAEFQAMRQTKELLSFFTNISFIRLGEKKSIQIIDVEKQIMQIVKDIIEQ